MSQLAHSKRVSLNMHHSTTLSVLIMLIVILHAISASALQSRELKAVGDPFDPPRTGEYRTLGEGPVASTHVAQIPNTNSFLLLSFITVDPKPPSNPDGTQILHIYDRTSNSYTKLDIPTNIVCGGWTHLSDGRLALFAGHSEGFGLREGIKNVHVFDPASRSVTQVKDMLQARWYATAITLPNGVAYTIGGIPYIPPGTSPRYDTRSEGAETYNFATGEQQLIRLNSALQDAGVGNFYIHCFVLPTGDLFVMNSNMVQVISPLTGEMRAAGPPLPEAVRNIRWEYPFQGSTITLMVPPPPDRGTVFRFEFMAFGGVPGDANDETPCSQYSVRYTLEVDTNGPQYRFVGDSPVLEEMPGRRCMHDAVLLPNGYVLLINGQERGIGGLDHLLNEPVLEPWLYNPSGPTGSRYSRTGAFSPIPRGYHSTALLTDKGDVFIGGCNTCGSYLRTTQDRSKMTLTTYGNAEYRNDIYSPSFLFGGERPTISSAPGVMQYNRRYSMTYRGGRATSIVLMNTGTVTHGHTMNHRGISLRFRAAGRGNSLLCQAPPNANHAPPGWYLMFVAVEEGSRYSEGRWVQVRA